DLLLCRQQAHLADVLQEQLKRIGRHVRLQVKGGLRLAPAALVRRALDFGGREGRIDFLNELNLSSLEESVQLLDVGLVEIELGDRAGDLGERQYAKLLPAIDEA